MIFLFPNILKLNPIVRVYNAKGGAAFANNT